MEESEHHYNIEDLAERVDLPVRTIRYYISEGLLPGPGARGKAALYGEEHLLRLRLIRLLSRQHVPLVDMRNKLTYLSISEIRALLAEEEAHEARFEQVKEQDVSVQSEGYVASLLRKARVARESQPPAYSSAPEQDRVERMGASVPAGSPEQASAAENWQRWELAPGIELHVRAESKHQHRHLLERLFQVAGKRYTQKKE